MVTPRRPWPNWALAAKAQVLDLAAEIDYLVDQASIALEQQNYHKLRVIHSEMQVAATRISNVMLVVEGDESEVCRDCPEARALLEGVVGKRGKVVSFRK